MLASGWGGLAAVVLASALVAFPAEGADAQASAAQPILGILKFANRLASDDRARSDAVYIEDAIRAQALRTLQGFRVVDRADLTLLAQAQGKDLAECEGSCAVETARNLGLDYVVTGDLTRFGDSYKVVVRLNRASDGAQLAGAQASGPSLEQLDRSLEEAARQLLAPLARRGVRVLQPGLLDGAMAAGPARFPLGLSLAGAADPSRQTLGFEALLSADLEPVELRVGVSLAPHVGLRAALLVPWQPLRALQIAAGVRLLLVPGLTAGVGAGGGPGVEVGLRLLREVTLVLGGWLEAYRYDGAFTSAPLVTVGLQVRL